MAARYYGINRGDIKFVSEGAATTGKGLELVIADTSTGWTRQEVLDHLETIQRHILSQSVSNLKL